MLFNSLEFLIFFPIVAISYFLIPHRFRWVHLLIASVYFYMSVIPIYILVLLLLIIIDYTAAIFIENNTGKKRKIYLVISVLSTCSVLFIFKYFNFFNQNFTALAQFLHWNYSMHALKLALPIGLSFHTFQSLSYVIEVYKGTQKAEKNFGIYSVYVLFFPQLVAGPIERAKNLIHQFYEEHFVDFARITDGLKLMLWGLFKKVVIADRLSILVNVIYNDPTSYGGISLIVATVFFAFQIYCDFSGYTDIAIGAAQVLGFKLMDNFKRPYFSRSISEFWKRWHISLSTWFKDYVYIPLGGNRVSVPRWYFNLFFVFLISGLWHGANWTFIIWGALHGFYLIFSLITAKYREKFVKFIGLTKIPKVYHLIQVFITFVLVCIGWIFFRANSLSDAIYILTHLLQFTTPLSSFNTGLEIHEFFLAVGLILFMEFIHIIQEHTKIRHFLSNKPVWVRYPLYLTLLLLIIIFGVFHNSPFIYFQF